MYKSLINFISSYKDLISVFVIALLLGGIILTMQLNKNSQTIQSKAFSNGVKLSLQTQKSSISVGEIISVDLLIDTNNLQVSAADLHISYPSEVFDLVSFVIPENATLNQILGPGPIDSNSNRTADVSVPGKIAVQAGSGTSAKTGTGTLATVILKAKNTSSNAEIAYESNTQIAALDYNVNVLESTSILVLNVNNSVTPTQASSMSPSTISNKITVDIVQPTDSFIVSREGYIPIVATAESQTPITIMEIFVDKALIYSCNNTSSCSYNLRGRKLPPGDHIIKVVAIDSSGIFGSDEVKITAINK